MPEEILIEEGISGNVGIKKLIEIDQQLDSRLFLRIPIGSRMSSKIEESLKSLQCYCGLSFCFPCGIQNGIVRGLHHVFRMK